MVKTRGQKRKTSPKKVPKPAARAKRIRGQAKADDENPKMNPKMSEMAQAFAKGGPDVKTQLMKLMGNLLESSQLDADDEEEMVEAIDGVSEAYKHKKEVDPEALRRDQTMLDALNSPYENQVKEDMKLLCKDGVKNGPWRRIKVIMNENVLITVRFQSWASTSP